MHVSHRAVMLLGLQLITYVAMSVQLWLLQMVLHGGSRRLLLLLVTATRQEVGVLTRMISTTTSQQCAPQLLLIIKRSCVNKTV
jgi:hypothetical protein